LGSAAVRGTVGFGEGDLPRSGQVASDQGENKVHDELKGLKWWLRYLIEEKRKEKKTRAKSRRKVNCI
jgi:hypothetical protein